MTKNLFISIFLIALACTSNAQNTIEWAEDYKLTLNDFISKEPKTGQMQTATGSFSVTYEMGGVNLITTRNLNKNVSATFQKDASYITTGTKESTTRLLNYQQLLFNLYELQARNFRKKLFTERTHVLTKGPAVLHQEALAEHNRLLSEIESETFNGSVSEEITKWNQWTLQEIGKLNDFCKECKPSKKKRKKK